MKKKFIFHNNQFIETNQPFIYYNDRGLIFGDGIFETMLAHKNTIPFFDQHWQRFIHSAELLDISLVIDNNDYNKKSILAIIKELITLNHVSDSSNYNLGIKIILTRGTPTTKIRDIAPTAIFKSSLIISTFETESFELKHKTLKSMTDYRVNSTSILTRIKSLNYLDKILAKKTAIASGFDDALLINLNDCICEATTSNIFFVDSQNNIFTPRLTDGILPGITRSYVMTNLRKLGFTVIEQSIYWPLEQYRFKEVFITNAIMGVSSISKIDEMVFESDYFARMVLSGLCLRFTEQDAHPSLLPE